MILRPKTQQKPYKIYLPWWLLTNAAKLWASAAGRSQTWLTMIVSTHKGELPQERVQHVHNGECFRRRNEEGAESENTHTLIPKSFFHICVPKDRFCLNVFSYW